MVGLLLGMLLLSPGCSTAEPGESAGGSILHTVTVVTQGGMPLADVGVRVYADQAQEQLIWAAETDKDGTMTFQATASDTYVAVLQDVPAGYRVEETYPVTTDTRIVPEVHLLDGALSSYDFELGSILADFTVMATDGTEHTLSTLLQEKKAVILNFWFEGCMPCKMEFPYLQQAYEAYQDDIQVLAINPVDGTNSSIAAYAQEQGLTFPMAVGNSAWISSMGLTAYPTTVVIDRYGMIGMIHRGSVTDAQTFMDVFAYFVSGDYVQTPIRNMSDIL